MRTTTDDDTLELRLTRVLPATPDRVFDAYTDAEKQRIWFSILDATPGIVEIEVDLRVGGQQTAVWGPDRDTLFRETQTFLVIERPTADGVGRLVTESAGSSPDGLTMTTHIDVTFEPVDGGTLMTVVQSGFPSVDVRDFFASTAWVGALDRIEAFLTR
ncbi:SRPBCC domain-containing protein [Cellulomonas sp. URHD0024]|uniref:SRPBCC family protein n=1 Tax=Cellulomonas sp. URHD0024 TaxID=1302620 RepID=UPI0005500557|nr:SRPBCC domain-containing protein [Cellulomonas sp. URHD0024]